MKKWVWIIGAVVLMAAVAAGSFWGGMTYQSNKADQARANFETMRGPFAGGQPPSFAQGTQGGGNLGDGTQAGQAFRGAGIIGQIKEIDGDTLTISTAQDVTTVNLSDATQIIKSVQTEISELQPGMRIMVAGQPDEDGNITAVQITIVNNDQTEPDAQKP